MSKAMRYFPICFMLLLGSVYAVTQCSVGESFEGDCHSCNCLVGIWNCTEKPCDNPIPKPDETVCLVGDVYQGDCIACICLEKVWNCTKKPCLAPIQNAQEKCNQPGASYEEDCNTCYCTVNGVWACTRRVCPSTQQKREATPLPYIQSREKPDMNVPEEFKDTSCFPLDYFNVSCETCYCKFDGSGYLCTDSRCNDDELSTTIVPINDNGTLIISKKVAELVMHGRTTPKKPDVENNLNLNKGELNTDTNTSSRTRRDLDDELENDINYTGVTTLSSVLKDEEFEKKLIEAVG